MPPELDNTQGIERLLTDIALAISQSVEKYRIGDILYSTIAANPGAAIGDGGLGYGTWVAMPNVFLVGKGTGTFATAGATGGAEAITLSAAQSGLPAHTHATVMVPRDTAWAASNGGFNYSYTSGATYSTPSVAANAAQAASASHPNLPPYEVVYIWKRTA